MDIETSDLIFEARQITKNYPGTCALDRVDFSLKKGEIHALVGENGAGKSTLMQIMAGVLKPDQGTLLLNGIGDPPARSQPCPTSGHQSCIPGAGIVHQHECGGKYFYQHPTSQRI